jgi:hypothetical protein
MHRYLLALTLALTALALAPMAFASGVDDGKAMVEPAAHDRYAIDGYIMGKAELFGYISDLMDREHVDGVVLRRGASDAQRAAVGSIAKALHLAAFEQDGGDLKPLAAGS